MKSWYSGFTNLDAFSKREVETPPMDKIILQDPKSYYKRQQIAWKEWAVLIQKAMLIMKIKGIWYSSPWNLNHMPHTAPCISRKHRSHNFNKAAFTWQDEIRKGRSNNIPTRLQIITLHKGADEGLCTILASPQLLCLEKKNKINGNNHTIGCATGKRIKLFQNSHHSYLWTSRSPLLFVICQVNPLLGSKPGCEISKPCFRTNAKYLQSYWQWHSQLQLRKSRNLRKDLLGLKCSLLCIEMLHPQVLIPNEYVVIWCHYIWMQKSFGIPPNIKIYSNSHYHLMIELDKSC